MRAARPSLFWGALGFRSEDSERTRTIAARLCVAVAAVALVVAGASSGCGTIPNPSCGEEPAAAICGRLQFECGSAVVCYACGVAKRVQCGACGGTQTCGGGGTPHVCWPPLSDGGEDAAAPTADAGSDAAAADDAAAPDDAAADAAVEDGGEIDAALAPDAMADDAGPDAPPALVLCPDDAAIVEDDAATP